MTADYDHKSGTMVIAKRIGIGIVFFFGLVFLILAIAGCASGLPKYSEIYQRCIAQGGTPETCHAAATEWTMNNPTSWGGR